MQCMHMQFSKNVFIKYHGNDKAYYQIKDQLITYILTLRTFLLRKQ